MELVALIKDPQHVCYRYRIEAFRPFLEHSGYRLTYRILPKNTWARVRLYSQLRGTVVLLQRFLLPCWELALLRWQTHRLLYDFDDAVFLRDSYSKRGQLHPRRMRRFAATVATSDIVVAGNNFLAEQAGKWTRSDKIRVIPTCIDSQRYHGQTRTSPSDGKELVWIGSSSTLQGLERIAPLFEALGKDIPGLRLRVICDRFPNFHNLDVIQRPWSPQREVEDLIEADIGISWIPDDLWSRGKCGLKILQYMTASLPVLANPVGVHPEMIRHGENGFLATTFEQWRTALLQLTQNKQLRQKMGQSGRLVSANEYHVSHGSQAWLDVLSRLG